MAKMKKAKVQTAKLKTQAKSPAKTKIAAKAKSKPATKASAKAGAKPKAKLSVKSKMKASPKAATKSATQSTKPNITQKSASKLAPKKNATQAKKIGTAAKTPAVASFFSPLDDRILVRRTEAPERSAGGIILLASAAEKPNYGEVVAVGRGHLDKKGRLRPLDVQLGDQVLFASHRGSEIELNGFEVLVLRESEILAVYNP